MRTGLRAAVGLAVATALMAHMTGPFGGPSAATGFLPDATWALCHGAGGNDPSTPSDRPLDNPDRGPACCILCVVAGLAAGPEPVMPLAPERLGLTVVITTQLSFDLPNSRERTPVHPRAPPA